MSNNISIASSAMLVELSISTWTARKLDKAVTEEVNLTKGASRRAARVNKNLLADTPQLDSIQKLASEVRTWLHANTMPWSDQGPRLIPTAAYFEFKRELDAYKGEFNRQVDAFITAYPTLIAAQAFKLGTMFNRSEFPSADSIRHKFGFHATFAPVPDAGDFRVDIGNEAERVLKEEYEKAYEARLNSAMDDIRTRLRTSLEHVSNRLGYDGDKKRVFRDSLIDNLKHILRSANLMNLVDDEALATAQLEAERLISSVTPQELRKEESIRDDVKARVDDILERFAI